MTYHMSNPNTNPKKLSRKERKKIWKKSQICRQTPIKSNMSSTGFVSPFNRLQTEFESSKDKLPKSFESWRYKSIPQVVKLQYTEDHSGHTHRIIDTSIIVIKPPILPKRSQTAGLKKGKAPVKECVDYTSFRMGGKEEKKTDFHGELK